VVASSGAASTDRGGSRRWQMESRDHRGHDTVSHPSFAAFPNALAHEDVWIILDSRIGKRGRQAEKEVGVEEMVRT